MVATNSKRKESMATVNVRTLDPDDKGPQRYVVSLDRTSGELYADPDNDLPVSPFDEAGRPGPVSFGIPGALSALAVNTLLNRVVLDAQAVLDAPNENTRWRAETHLGQQIEQLAAELSD